MLDSHHLLTKSVVIITVLWLVRSGANGAREPDLALDKKPEGSRGATVIANYSKRRNWNRHYLGGIER